MGRLGPEEIKALPKSDLVLAERILNYWEWPEHILGDKPDGWDRMPNYQKTYMGKCRTRCDIIRPYMDAIREVLSDSNLI